MVDENYLSKRIEMIVTTCPKTKEIYEIGCDHGYITMSLLLSGKTQNVIATDISMNAISKAIINCQKKKLLPFISFRQGDGFQAYTRFDRATVSLISGLGGTEIVKMLDNIPSKITDVVISPMTDDHMVREWLVEHKFSIEKDFMFEDGGYYYNVIYAKKLKVGDKFQTESLYMYFGADNFKDEYKDEFIKYLKSEEERIITLYKKIGEISNSLNEKYQLITEALTRLGLELIPIE